MTSTEPIERAQRLQAVQLSIPYVSQIDKINPTATYSPSDCSMASLCMVLHAAGRTDVTVDQLSELSGEKRGYAYVLPAESVAVAARFGLRLQHRHHQTEQQLIDQLDTERPFIALVKYDLLPDRYLHRFTGGHWIVVTGYDYANFYYNDPYFEDARQGALKQIQRSKFMQAWRGSALNGNMPAQGLAVL